MRWRWRWIGWCACMEQSILQGYFGREILPKAMWEMHPAVVMLWMLLSLALPAWSPAALMILLKSSSVVFFFAIYVDVAYPKKKKNRIRY